MRKSRKAVRLVRRMANREEHCVNVSDRGVGGGGHPYRSCRILMRSFIHRFLALPSATSSPSSPCLHPSTLGCSRPLSALQFLCVLDFLLRSPLNCRLQDPFNVWLAVQHSSVASRVSHTSSTSESFAQCVRLHFCDYMQIQMHGCSAMSDDPQNKRKIEKSCRASTASHMQRCIPLLLVLALQTHLLRTCNHPAVRWKTLTP